MPNYRDNIRYVNYPIEPDLFDGLGIDPKEAGVRDVRDRLRSLHAIVRAAKPLGISEPIQIAAALRRYQTAIASERHKLARRFDRSEWNYLADVMNGCLDLYDYAETPLSLGVMMMANAQDGHKLNGTGHAHFEREEADAKVEALVRKLVKLSPIEADAIGLAIREFWADPGIDATTEEWWLPRAAAKSGKRKAGDGR